LQQIIDWMLAKDPAQRYPTPERAAQALQVFLVAGSEPPRSPEGDPRMRPYLKWLEANGGGVAVSAPAVAPLARPGGQSAPMPTAPVRPTGAATPAPQPAPPATPIVAPPKRPSGLIKPAAPATPTAPPSPAQVDVELVPAGPPGQSMEAVKRAMQLTRRDYIMLAVGAGGVLLAEGIGVLLSMALRRKPKDDESGNLEGNGKGQE